jgi:NAD(P)-dependent dehydrogenase (short-subunit alcohol dehydrogenase family)
MTNGTALVVGVGPALGAALGRRFAKAGELGTARTRDSV